MLKGQKSKTASKKSAVKKSTGVKKSTKKTSSRSSSKKPLLDVNAADLNSVMDAIKDSECAEIVLSRGESSIKLSRDISHAAAPAPVAKAPAPEKGSKPKIESKKPINTDHDEAEEGRIDIKSPDVGIFLRANDEKSEPFVKLRDGIKKGQIVALIHYMGISHEIRSDVEGKLVEILVEDGQAVVYGQPLFRLK